MRRTKCFSRSTSSTFPSSSSSGNSSTSSQQERLVRGAKHGVEALVSVFSRAATTAKSLNQWRRAQAQRDDGGFGPPGRKDSVSFFGAKDDEQEATRVHPTTATSAATSSDFYPANAELISLMTPNQRWYRRQFHEQHLVCSRDDVKDAILLIANEQQQEDQEQSGETSRVAIRVVDILVGTVDTSVSVTPEQYLNDIAPQIPSHVHAAVVCDLLVDRRQSWELLLLASRLDSEGDSKNSARHQLSASPTLLQLEQRLVRSVKFSLPPPRQQQQQLDRCKQSLAPYITRYALEDASILLDEHDQLVRSGRVASAVEASNYLTERLRLVAEATRDPAAARADGDDRVLLDPASTIRNQFIEQFAQRGDYIAAIRCWASWMNDIVAEAQAASSLEHQLQVSLRRYSTVTNATISAVAASMCRVGLWREGLQVIEQFQNFKQFFASSRSDSDATTKDFDDVVDLLLTHAFKKPSALKFLFENEQRKQLLLSNPQRVIDVQRFILSCDFAPRAERVLAKELLQNSVNSGNKDDVEGRLFELLCAAGDWKQAMVEVEEAINNSKNKNSNDTATFADAAVKLAQAGAPWQSVRSVLIKTVPNNEDDRFSALVRCAFAQGSWDAALKLFSSHTMKRGGGDNNSAASFYKLLDTPTMVSVIQQQQQNQQQQLQRSLTHVEFSAKTLALAGNFSVAIDTAISADKVRGDGQWSELLAVREAFFDNNKQQQQQQKQQQKKWMKLISAVRQRTECDLLNVWWWHSCNAKDKDSRNVEVDGDDPLCDFFSTSRRFAGLPFLHLGSGTWKQLVVEAGENVSSSSLCSKLFEFHIKHGVTQQDKKTTMAGSSLLMPPLPSTELVIAAAERAKQVLDAGSALFLFQQQQQQQRRRRNRSSLLVCIEPQDQLALSPLSPWEESSADAIAANTTTAKRTGVVSFEDALMKQSTLSKSPAALSTLLLERVNFHSRTASDTFNFLSQLSKTVNCSNFSLSLATALINRLTLSAEWCALTGLLRFTRTELKLTVPLESVTRVVEATAFALSEAEAAQLPAKARDVTACFNEVMLFGGASTSSASKRASAQRLASRSLHRSSWEEALAALDFAVWASRSSSSNTNSNNSNPVLAQSAIWRLCTADPATQPQQTAQAAMWHQLSKLPQPVLVPGQVFRGLAATSSSRMCATAVLLHSANHHNHSAATFIEQQQLRLGRINHRERKNDTTSVQRILRSELVKRSSTWQLASRILSSPRAPTSSSSSMSPLENLVLRAASRSGAFAFVFRVMHSRVVAAQSSPSKAATKLLRRCLLAAQRKHDDVVDKQQQQQQKSQQLTAVERRLFDDEEESPDLSLDAFLSGKKLSSTKQQKKQQQHHEMRQEQDDHDDDVDGEGANAEITDVGEGDDSAICTMNNAGIETQTLLCLVQCIAAADSPPSSISLELRKATVALLENLDSGFSSKKTSSVPSLNLLQQRQRYNAQVTLMRSIPGREDEAELLAAIAAGRFRRV